MVGSVRPVTIYTVLGYDELARSPELADLVNQFSYALFSLVGRIGPALHERQGDIKTLSVRHESVAGFMAELDRINALADATPGFVWRLKDEATGLSSR